jgi:hypothetical protein
MPRQMLAKRPQVRGGVRPGQWAGRLLEHASGLDQKVVQLPVLREQMPHDCRVCSVDRCHGDAS